MPYDIAFEPRGTLVLYHGHVTSEEVLRSVEAVTTDLRFDRLRYRINDWLGIDSFELQDGIFEQVAAISCGGALSRRDRGAGNMIAQIARAPEHVAVAERYASLGILPYRLATFPTVAQARGWIEQGLGIRPPAPTTTSGKAGSGAVGA